MGKKYCPEVQSQIKYYKDHLLKIKATDATAKLVRKTLPGVQIYCDYEVNISPTCKSMTEVKEMLGKLAKAGIMLEKFHASDTNPRWQLKAKDGCQVRLSPWWRSDDEGATCKLVQVGTETREFPIYKLMCDGKESAPTE
jgi:hypothetical protein